MSHKRKVPHTLLQYVKDAKGRRVGMLTGFLNVACRSVSIGWSLCHRTDEFVPMVGAAECLKHDSQPVPPSLYRLARRFRISCLAHFNDYVESIQPVVPVPMRRMPKTRKPRDIRNAGHRIGCGVHTIAGERVGCTCARLAIEGKRYRPKGMP